MQLPAESGAGGATADLVGPRSGRPSSIPSTINNRLRTGADKGNPTV